MYAADSGYYSDVFVIDAEGMNLRNLTNHEATDSFPVWSPDSQTIYLMSPLEDGTSRLLAVDADGGHLRYLTVEPAVYEFPSVGPGR